MSTIVERFRDLDSPAAFSGLSAVHRSFNKKHTLSKVRRALASDFVYSVYKPARQRFARLKTVPRGWMTDLQCDLADFQKLSRDNDGYRYRLVACDVMSRLVFAEPVRSKTTAHMKEAFTRLWKQLPANPKSVFTDKGNEFTAAAMRAFFKQLGVEQHNSENADVKAAHAERSIRTLKTRLYKYFAANSTTRWIDVIAKLTSAINNSVNRTTGVTPNSIDAHNFYPHWQRLYSSERVGTLSYYKLGDYVRIPHPREAFSKGYVSQFTDEVFRIARIHTSTPATFELVDGNNEPITGRFYEELSLSDKDTQYRVDKIIKSRTRKGVTEHLVQWTGFPRSQASWVTDVG